MQINISARHGQLSETTREKIVAKLEKLPRMFDRLTSIDVTVNLEHRDNPEVELQVAAEHKKDFVATVRADELMAGVDSVLHKVEQQLRRYKEKLQDRHRGGDSRHEEV